MIKQVGCFLTHLHPDVLMCRSTRAKPSLQNMNWRKINMSGYNLMHTHGGKYECVCVPVSPIYRTEIHSQHHTLLCVLTTIGWDHHHVAGDLSVCALQTHRLEQERNNLWSLYRWLTSQDITFCFNYWVYPPVWCCPLVWGEWTWFADAVGCLLVRCE